jgi:uncharacterized protein
MKKTFERALVTGASSGLGKALCHALAARGIPLLMAARSEEKLKQVAKSLSVPTQIYPVDLADASKRREFLAWLQGQAPDLVINNAGAGLYGPAVSHPIEEQSTIVELNAKALMEITLESARTLREQKRQGTILNVSSAAAFLLYPNHCIYAASKAFVNNFSQGLDFEIKSHGIRILASCPGLIDTEFSLRAAGGQIYKKSSLWTMSADRAAALILKQIDSGKSIDIIDFRYKCFIYLSKIIPEALLLRLMNATLKDKLKNNQISAPDTRE